MTEGQLITAGIGIGSNVGGSLIQSNGAVVTASEQMAVQGIGTLTIALVGLA
jgi:hypothetical protein